MGHFSIWTHFVLAVKKYDNKDGKLIFEGQYLNGAEWEGKGMVEELFKNLNITSVYYYGEFKEGKINGYGKKINTLFSKDKNDYEGNFIKGKKSGQGKEYYDLNNRKILIMKVNLKMIKEMDTEKNIRTGKLYLKVNT